MVTSGRAKAFSRTAWGANTALRTAELKLGLQAEARCTY
jgi:hypothetical protein